MGIIKPGFFSQTSHADVKRDEYDLKNEVIINNNVKVDYVFIGDSIIARWELEAYFKEYGVVINRGIGGDNSHYLNMRFDADAIQLKPKTIVLLIGVNDTMFYGTSYSLVDKNYETLRDRIVNNIKEMIQRARIHAIDIKVCSILPTKMVNDKYKEIRNAIIKEVNVAVNKYCIQNKVDYIDYYSKLVDCDELSIKDGYTSDGVHPNLNGYNYMYKTLKDSLD